MSEPKSPEEMANEAITEFERNKKDTSYYVPPHQLPFPVIEETETDELSAAPVPQVERQPNEDLTYSMGGGGGGYFLHPFQIIPVGETTWYVNETGSSIINDDDGTSIPIEGLEGNKSSTGFVYVSCDISSGSPSGTATLEVGGAPDEVVLDSSGEQTEANLLIAKVENGENFPAVCQAWNNAALLSRSFESGSLVWTFIAYPSHPDSLVPPADPDFS